MIPTKQTQTAEVTLKGGSVPGMPQQFTLSLSDKDARLLGAKPGHPIQLSLGVGDVHVDEELSTYLAGYHPTGFRADEASKVVLVDHDSDIFRTFDEDDAFLPVEVKGAIEAAIPEVDPVSATRTYKVIDRFIGSFVNDIVDRNATKLFRPRQQAMKRVKWALQLDRELDVWPKLLQLAASWNAAQTVTLGAGFEWNGGASSDPILDIQTRKEASVQQVTDVWFNERNANAFLRHPLVRDHMKMMIGDNAANAAIGNVANAQQMDVDFTIPGLANFHVVAGKFKATKTAAPDYILGNHTILTTSPPGVPTDGEEIASTYTFRRRGRNGIGFETREFRIENRGPQGGTMVVASNADIAVMTGNNVGGLIRDTVQ
jgi:hypothetical protein